MKIMQNFEEQISSRIEDWISAHNLFRDSETIIAAVSGGGDSVFLLWALRKLAPAHKLDIRAIHINHELRGEESDEDEEFVKNLCDKWRVPLYIYHRDVRKIARELKFGVEEAARHIRNQIFDDAARDFGGSIATGHTADDVAETMLFNLFRGSGVRGLAGILPRKENIIRPILPIWRHEARDILRSENILWRTDSSNTDRRFARNKIRLEVIPQIKKLFGRDAIEHIFSVSQMLHKTRTALENCFRMRYERALVGSCEGIFTFRADEALTDSFTTGEILRQVLPRFGIGLKKFSTAKVEQIFDEMTKNIGSKRCSIYDGSFAMRSGNCLIIADHTPIQMTSRTLPMNKKIELDGDLGNIRAIVASPPKKLVAGNILTAYLKYSGEKMQMKPYRSDYDFHPLGGVSMKLSSFLKKRRVPVFFRKALPLVFIGEKLAWVAGVEISERFKITHRTKRVVRVEWSGNFSDIFASSIALSREK